MAANVVFFPLRKLTAGFETITRRGKKEEIGEEKERNKIKGRDERDWRKTPVK